MKSGASDPFSDDEDDAEPATAEEDVEAQQNAGGEALGEGADGGESAGNGETTGDESDALDRSQIPYTLRRDNVKDERPHVHQLFVQDATDDAARDAERELEDILGTDVYRLDAREAIYRIGMRHPEEVADLLEEWGYNF